MLSAKKYQRWRSEICLTTSSSPSAAGTTSPAWRPTWWGGEEYSSFSLIIIGPESDHWKCLSLTHWLTDSLTHSCLVNLIDVTLACEDANSKLFDVVTVADVDDEDRVGNSLLQISALRFGQKAKLLFRLWAQGLVNILKLKFRQDFKLKFDQYLAAEVL